MFRWWRNLQKVFFGGLGLRIPLVVGPTIHHMRCVMGAMFATSLAWPACARRRGPEILMTGSHFSEAGCRPAVEGRTAFGGAQAAAPCVAPAPLRRHAPDQSGSRFGDLASLLSILGGGFLHIVRPSLAMVVGGDAPSPICTRTFPGGCGLARMPPDKLHHSEHMLLGVDTWRPLFSVRGESLASGRPRPT